jgi:hypothetical protein
MSPGIGLPIDPPAEEETANYVAAANTEPTDECVHCGSPFRYQDEDAHAKICTGGPDDDDRDDPTNAIYEAEQQAKTIREALFHKDHTPDELDCDGCDVDDNSNVYLRASGYEWTCVCGRLNHIVGVIGTVTCGKRDRYGKDDIADDPRTPAGCGREFEVGDHGHCYD